MDKAEMVGRRGSGFADDVYLHERVRSKSRKSRSKTENDSPITIINLGRKSACAS